MYYAYMHKYNNKVQTHFSVCNEWLVFKAMATAMTALSDISSILPNGKGYKQCWCSTADLTLNKAIYNHGIMCGFSSIGITSSPSNSGCTKAAGFV